MKGATLLSPAGHCIMYCDCGPCWGARWQLGVYPWFGHEDELPRIKAEGVEAWVRAEMKR